MLDNEKLRKTLAAIDEINNLDERSDEVDGKSWPKEYLYSQRASEILSKFQPDVNDLLQIAVRGHHIQRWIIPREEYPMDRKGYLQWRTKLKLHHADLLAQIMTENGYSEDETKAVRQMVMKNKLKTDTNTQALEDVICLVFLSHYLDDFIIKHTREKVIGIIQKTWAKMSKEGQEFALNLQLSANAGSIVKEALS